jgi:hypothetical protein
LNADRARRDGPNLPALLHVSVFIHPQCKFVGYPVSGIFDALAAMHIFPDGTCLSRSAILGKPRVRPWQSPCLLAGRDGVIGTKLDRAAESTANSGGRRDHDLARRCSERRDRAHAR